MGNDGTLIPVNVSDVSVAAENEFAFIEHRGWPLFEWSEIFPESFKGGFRIKFGTASRFISIEYLDWQISIFFGREQIFGADVHPGFVGNMFSPEHFLSALPKIRQAAEERVCEIIETLQP